MCSERNASPSFFLHREIAMLNKTEKPSEGRWGKRASSVACGLLACAAALLAARPLSRLLPREEDEPVQISRQQIEMQLRRQMHDTSIPDSSRSPEQSFQYMLYRTSPQHEAMARQRDEAMARQRQETRAATRRGKRKTPDIMLWDAASR